MQSQQLAGRYMPSILLPITVWLRRKDRATRVHEIKRDGARGGPLTVNCDAIRFLIYVVAVVVAPFVGRRLTVYP
jgi:hypothetical protein